MCNHSTSQIRQIPPHCHFQLGGFGDPSQMQACGPAIVLCFAGTTVPGPGSTFTSPKRAKTKQNLSSRPFSLPTSNFLPPPAGLNRGAPGVVTAPCCHFVLTSPRNWTSAFLRNCHHNKLTHWFEFLLHSLLRPRPCGSASTFSICQSLDLSGRTRDHTVRFDRGVRPFDHEQASSATIYSRKASPIKLN